MCICDQHAAQPRALHGATPLSSSNSVTFESRNLLIPKSFPRIYFVQTMISERLFQCRGDSSTYIQHLELRVLDLESAHATCRCPNSERGRQLTNVQSRSCDVCEDPGRYFKSVSPARPVDSFSFSRPDESDNSTLQVEIWQPQREVVKKTSSTKSHAKAIAQLYSKFESLPNSDNWKDLMSFNEVSRKEILLRLISGFDSPENISLSNVPPNSLTSVLHEYCKSMQATLSAQAGKRKSKNKPYTCFRELVFCSLCAVAQKYIESETVYNIMRSVFGSDASSDRFRALIRGAKWANKIIYHLSQTKFGLRSWDMIYSGTKLVRINVVRANSGKLESWAPGGLFCPFDTHN